MAAFEDKTGRVWAVDITVGTVKRVRSLLGEDLMDVVGGGDLLERIVSDPVLLADMLYVICRPQAELENVTDDDFGAALAGDAIDAATKAFLEGLTDFFPQRRARLMKIALQKMETLQNKAEAMVEDLLTSGKLDEALLAGMSGISSGDQQASSDSTPTG